MQQSRDPLPGAETRITDREENLRRLAQNGVWDLAVVGGGATGAGLAFEAARRGLQVVLLEADDFGHGTSSRSTKLVHGGVRYLAQGRVGLVYEALHERARLGQDVRGCLGQGRDRRPGHDAGRVRRRVERL